MRSLPTPPDRIAPARHRIHVGRLFRWQRRARILASSARADRHARSHPGPDADERPRHPHTARDRHLRLRPRRYASRGKLPPDHMLQPGDGRLHDPGRDLHDGAHRPSYGRCAAGCQRMAIDRSRARRQPLRRDRRRALLQSERLARRPLRQSRAHPSDRGGHPRRPAGRRALWEDRHQRERAGRRRSPARRCSC